LAAVEAADALIVGTPVYRASFTGLFKHFFDFVEQTALVDVPVLLAASGGSDRHALVLEHQLRPLFSFSKHKPYRLASMPLIVISRLNIRLKASNCLIASP
jgi:MsuE subfamily FMN reductase